MGRMLGRKRLTRMLWICPAVFVFLFAAEAAVFRFLSRQPDTLRPSDAVVVFDGALSRIEKGAELTRRNLAPVLIISPAGPGRLPGYRRRFSVSEAVTMIPEPKARTTYENAFYTAEIIQKNGFGSVTLVTSDYHMPRAYLLLRMMLAGEGVAVQRAAAASSGGVRSDGAAGCRMHRALYNEMVQFWGSLCELAYHRWRGKMIPRRLRRSRPIVLLEKWLLLQ
jgi:uncharacterized SAM-binding protein YcdF (DUF218 family)